MVAALLAAGTYAVLRSLRPAPRLVVDCAAVARARAAAPAALQVVSTGAVRDSDFGRAWRVAVKALSPAAQQALAPSVHVLRIPGAAGLAPPDVIALLPAGWLHVRDVSRFLGYRRHQEEDGHVVCRSIGTREVGAYLDAHPQARWRARVQGADCR